CSHRQPACILLSTRSADLRLLLSSPTRRSSDRGGARGAEDILMIISPAAHRRGARWGPASTLPPLDASRTAMPTMTPPAARSGTLTRAIALMEPGLRAHRLTLGIGLLALVLSVWTRVSVPVSLKQSIDSALA